MDALLTESAEEDELRAYTTAMGLLACYAVISGTHAKSVSEPYRIQGIGREWLKGRSRTLSNDQLGPDGVAGLMRSDD
jgi:hypothetical protein